MKRVRAKVMSSDTESRAVTVANNNGVLDRGEWMGENQPVRKLRQRLPPTHVNRRI